VVRVRVRLPDGALLERGFSRRGESGGDAQVEGRGPSAADVYALARRCLRRWDAPFEIRYYPDVGPGAPAAGLQTLPDSQGLALLDDDDGDEGEENVAPARGKKKKAEKKGLGWRGNVLVSLVWGPDADRDAVAGPMLNQEVSRGARTLDVVMPAMLKKEYTTEVAGEEKDVDKGLLGGLFTKEGANKAAVDVEAKLKNFLFGSKKK
jgi:hypothetical protein